MYVMYKRYKMGLTVKDTRWRRQSVGGSGSLPRSGGNSSDLLVQPSEADRNGEGDMVALSNRHPSPILEPIITSSAAGIERDRPESTASDYSYISDNMLDMYATASASTVTPFVIKHSEEIKRPDPVSSFSHSKYAAPPITRASSNNLKVRHVRDLTTQKYPRMPTEASKDDLDPHVEDDGQGTEKVGPVLFLKSSSAETEEYPTKVGSTFETLSSSTHTRKDPTKIDFGRHPSSYDFPDKDGEVFVASTTKDDPVVNPSRRYRQRDEFTKIEFPQGGESQSSSQSKVATKIDFEQLRYSQLGHEKENALKKPTTINLTQLALDGEGPPPVPEKDQEPTQPRRSHQSRGPRRYEPPPPSPQFQQLNTSSSRRYVTTSTSPMPASPTPSTLPVAWTVGQRSEGMRGRQDASENARSPAPGVIDPATGLVMANIEYDAPPPRYSMQF
ncbi:hypothetical protein HDU67_003470 [Dinochytrium kinnereticum]|nr:hypothetical protein HDU67_003470 [Dinochytrium kinnereticum]